MFKYGVIAGYEHAYQKVEHCNIELTESRVARVRGFSNIHEHQQSHYQVLPAVVNKKVGNPHVEPAAMVKQKPVQMFELSKIKVTDCSSTLALPTKNAHSDVCLLYHPDIISTIPNGQDYSLQPVLDKFDN